MPCSIPINFIGSSIINGVQFSFGKDPDEHFDNLDNFDLNIVGAGSVIASSISISRNNS